MACRGLSHARAFTVAAALFAITLNAFLPLAHAAAMRVIAAGGASSNGPAARALWSTLCLAGEESGADTNMPAPTAGKKHQCCVGLPHAWVLVDQNSIAARIDIAVAHDDGRLPQPPISAAIRDGPVQPRAPPFLV